MEIFQKKIPKEFLESLPEGMKLVRRNNKNFLVVEKLLCPNGHILMDESIQIHEEPAIKLKVKDGFNHGYLFVDAFWGSHSKLYSFIPKHSESLDSLEIECPICGVSLTFAEKCSLSSCSSMKAVELKLPGKNRIIACAKLGCPGHRMEITELPGSVAAAVSNINFYVENFDNNDFFMGV